MAFLEWRRFNFFDIIYDADGGSINKALEDVRVTATGSGHGLLVLGDSDGKVHLITRNFTFNTFQAYNININLLEMSRNLPYLVTVGSDEPGVNPLIKMWDVDKVDRHGSPVCLRILRAALPSRAVQATCLCLNESLTIMAVGFVDGSVALYRGNLPRERRTKQKILQENQQSVTGISIQETSKNTYLFVVTLSTVDFYNITHKDRETKTRLDVIGCSAKCSLLLDYVSMDHFMICRDDAVYCYTTDGRGPCYAIEGQKIMVQAFKSYIVIIAKDSTKKKTQNSSTATPAIGNEQKAPADKDLLTLTVLDIQNKFIVFSVPLKEVEAVLAEWGSFYLLTGSNSMCQLVEKDLQSKLALLLKKNLYDVSIRIAKNHHYDEDALVEIFLQYGDHLYYKGDHNGAIEQYMKTIGKLEPSYVIRKLVASHQIDKLTTYLQALHKQGQATADHTALLLNCYTKLNQIDKLKEFIMKDRDVKFDVEVALNVCRQTSSVDALLLAEKHRLHSWYLKIQIEDNNQLSDALSYLAKLDFNEAVENTIRYGSILMEKAPKETTQFLKRLCTNYRPSEEQNQLATDGLLDQYDRAPPEDFIHLFLNNPECLIDFLEHLIETSSKLSQLVYNTLVEHYLHVWSKLSEFTGKLHYEQKIIKILESPESNCDKHQVLILCQAVNFRPGLIFLYEENKMYQQILQYHLTQKDYDSAIACCQRFGNQDSSLWVQALWAGARHRDVPSSILKEILYVIESKQLLSPLEVVDAVCSWKSVEIGDVRSYLNSVLRNELKTTDHEQALIRKYTEDSSRIRKLIHDLQNSPITFQGSRCSACNNQLELPSVHFLCQHSFHQHCFQSYADHENECPECLPNNKQIFDVIKAQAQNSDLHETFHSQLERADDGFSLVADYFGRGIFNKLTIINDEMRKKSIVSNVKKSAKIPEVSPTTQVRNQRPQSLLPKTMSAPAKEESYSSTLEANLSPGESCSAELTPASELRLADAIANQSSPQSYRQLGNNPFEQEDYPRSNNPFDDDDDADDYDKNLNPFAS
ncbi:vacuolar protein sorting-associated protein 11 homolog [Nilaparvata lugens]|uniref:vacuolar protein sorting-associated protein 11 homolog n=1 Tax=Nilaparvata lugens TaxID=108931 RepID=UPI00193C9CA5|nr:vacuolar protein sorting-associated protein 11 homolog [Nilaparvata lugens]